MTTPTPQSLQVVGVGIASASTGSMPLSPIVTTRTPAVTDVMGGFGPYKIGQRWINSSANASYELTSISPLGGVLSATWTPLGLAAGTFAQITTQDAGTVTPSAGNVNLSGVSGQLTTTGSGSTATIGFTNAVTFPGSAATTTTLAVGTNATVAGTLAVTGASTLTGAVASGALTVTGAIAGSTTITAGTNITATNGNLTLGTAGNKLLINAGANGSIGTATLVAGTVVVATTAVTAASKIFVSHNTVGGTVGVASAPTASIIAGTSFVINSSNAADTSSVNWWFVN